jgi:hypothetical protein
VQAGSTYVIVSSRTQVTRLFPPVPLDERWALSTKSHIAVFVLHTHLKSARCGGSVQRQAIDTAADLRSVTTRAGPLAGHIDDLRGVVLHVVTTPALVTILHSGDAVAGVGARLRAGVDAVFIIGVQLSLQ